ncbi:MAG TPA: hypothetical protein VF600_09840 [Abditibacteriaceae bacterium]|jgi:F0F1-type ATP synthase assembly protein I
MGEGAILMAVMIVLGVIAGAWILVKAARRVGEPLDREKGKQKY